MCVLLYYEQINGDVGFFLPKSMQFSKRKCFFGLLVKASFLLRGVLFCFWKLNRSNFAALVSRTRTSFFIKPNASFLKGPIHLHRFCGSWPSLAIWLLSLIEKVMQIWTYSPQVLQAFNYSFRDCQASYILYKSTDCPAHRQGESSWSHLPFERSQKSLCVRLSASESFTKYCGHCTVAWVSLQRLMFTSSVAVFLADFARRGAALLYGRGRFLGLLTRHCCA